MFILRVNSQDELYFDLVETTKWMHMYHLLLSDIERHVFKKELR